MNDVTINKVSGGLGRRFPSTDMVSGLLANGPALPGAQHGVVYKLRSIDDALAMGINAEYDETMEILVYEHIKEFFRINPNGELFFMLVPQVVSAVAVTYKQMVDPTEADFAKKLLTSPLANGTINQLAVAFNPDTPVSDDTQLMLAIAKAQLLADDEYSKHRPVHILLEGKGFTSSSISDIRDLQADSVSVFIGQNKAVASKLSAYNKYAAIGTLLGSVSASAVNESISWVLKNNVYGDDLQDYSISNVASESISPSLLSDLHDAGYIFFIRHAQRDGLYYNESSTATAVTDDYCFIENNRTINKATRLIRQAMLPYLNSPIPVNTTDGTIDAVTVKSMEAAGNKVLRDGMNGEVSGFVFSIDETQDILSTSELACTLQIIPTGTARAISIQIGFSNPFNA